ncbi:hypothetical protein [Skermania piniformis]|uniref:Uncharacterized protein n=1 Tax=Skermania pinensis TaxID=39122 RepID=A0ABX8SFG1_9ACTN|nr:hypothetical protein [Skermania piniformis]QXQ14431.1 hypothetical protein KV203_03165 [Skermania piniformis]
MSKPRTVAADVSDDLAGLPPPRNITACTTGKLGYPDRDTAEAYLASMDRNNSRRREQRSYRCQFCGNWHLTSRPFVPRGTTDRPVTRLNS